MDFRICPRCQFKAFEVLKTYSHCVSCDYFIDSEEAGYKSARVWAPVIKQMQAEGTLFPELDPNQTLEEKTEAA